jgi:hypothetical protein
LKNDLKYKNRLQAIRLIGINLESESNIYIMIKRINFSKINQPKYLNYII